MAWIHRRASGEVAGSDRARNRAGFAAKWPGGENSPGDTRRRAGNFLAHRTTEGGGGGNSRRGERASGQHVVPSLLLAIALYGIELSERSRDDTSVREQTFISRRPTPS